MSGDETRNFYDLVAPEYAARFFRELDSKPFDRMVLQRFAAQTRRDGILCDMGCGPGEVAVHLHSIGSRVIGVDLSEGMINQARQLSPNLQFYQDDMLHLSFPDQHFSGIAAFYAIVHCSLDELDRAFTEWYRVLELGGILLFSFHVGRETLHLDEFLGKKVSADFTFFEPDDILPKLRKVGFKIDDVLIRYPYEDVEYPSKRCYVFASR